MAFLSRLGPRHLVEILLGIVIFMIASILGVEHFRRAQKVTLVVALHQEVAEVLHTHMEWSVENGFVRERFVETSGITGPITWYAQDMASKTHEFLSYLTTPVAHLPHVPEHPFERELDNEFPQCDSGKFFVSEHWRRELLDPCPTSFSGWSAYAGGPDGFLPACGLYMTQEEKTRLHKDDRDNEVSLDAFAIRLLPWRHYDPSNGLLSRGFVLADSLGRRSAGFRLVQP